MSWYQATIRYEAEDDEEAKELYYTLVNPLCAGTGEGDEHQCARKFYGTLIPANALVVDKSTQIE